MTKQTAVDKALEALDSVCNYGYLKDNKLWGDVKQAHAELKQWRDGTQDNLNQAYTERNILASIACKMAIALGFKAGIGKDNNEDWDDEWRNLIYIELPNGQISYHIAPHDLSVIKDLPEYDGKWDGTFLSKDLKTSVNLSYAKWRDGLLAELEGMKKKPREFGSYSHNQTLNDVIKMIRGE